MSNRLNDEQKWVAELLRRLDAGEAVAYEELADCIRRLQAKSPAAQGAVDETHDYARAVAYAKKMGLPTDFPPIPRPAPAGERDALVSDAYTDATFKAVWIDPAMGTTLDDNDSEHIASAALETPASLPAIPAAPAAPNATPRTCACCNEDCHDILHNRGIIEVAIRNASVSEYMRHWEERTEEAERKWAAVVAPAKVLDKWCVDEVLKIGERHQGNSIEITTTLWNHVVRLVRAHIAQGKVE